MASTPKKLVSLSAFLKPNHQSQYKLQTRPREAHKHDFGPVLIIGGDHGMTGAIRLAGEAAMRVGAGSVKLVSRPELAAFLNLARPELICVGVSDWHEMEAHLETARAVAIGPGLGQSPWAQDLFQQTMQARHPLVIDADGLNILAKTPCRNDRWILTPHPGEAGRLLGCSTAEVQQDRVMAILKLQERYGGSVILKGARTLILTESGADIFVCEQGNSGMATAGMGDVLTGVIVGLLAQGLARSDAACLGVHLHACAGDMAAKGGERGMIASDLFTFLRQLVNPCSIQNIPELSS